MVEPEAPEQVPATRLVPASRQGTDERARITYTLSQREADYWNSKLGRALEDLRGQLAHQLAEASSLPVGACLPLVAAPELEVAGTNVMNAWTTPTRPPRIVVNHGFLVFLYELARIVASRIDPPPETADSVSKTQTAGAIARLLRITSMAYPDTMVTRRGFVLTEQQTVIATSLALAAERFVLAHESIHCNYHFPGASAFSLVGSELPENHETQADILGTKLLIECLARLRPEVHPAEIYAGIEIFFHAQSLYEGSGARVAVGEHPPADQRLQDLRQLLTANNGAEFMRRLTAYSRPIGLMIADWRPLILHGGGRSPR